MKEKETAGTSVSALNGAYMLKHCKCAMRTNVKNLMTGIAIIIASIILIMIPQEGIVTDKNFTSAFYMFGILGTCYGIYFMLSKNRKTVYEPTGSTVVHRLLYYDFEEQGAIDDFINGKAATLPPSRTQGGIMLRAYVAQDGSMACLQPCKYHDLVYEPLCSPTVLSGELSSAMTEYVRME